MAALKGPTCRSLLDLIQSARRTHRVAYGALGDLEGEGADAALWGLLEHIQMEAASAASVFEELVEHYCGDIARPPNAPGENGHPAPNGLVQG